MVVINGYISVCDGVIIIGMSMVIKVIIEFGIYFLGLLYLINKEWWCSIVYIWNFGDMKDCIKVFEFLIKLFNIEDK